MSLTNLITFILLAVIGLVFLIDLYLKRKNKLATTKKIKKVVDKETSDRKRFNNPVEIMVTTLLLLIVLFFIINHQIYDGRLTSNNNVVKNNLKQIINEPCDLMSYTKEIILKLEKISDKYENISELDVNERKQVIDYIFYIREAWLYSYNKFPDFHIGSYEDCWVWGEMESVDSPFDKVVDFYPLFLEEIDALTKYLEDDQKK